MNNTADESRHLCSACVGEAVLRAEIARDGQDGICFYCEKQGKTITVGQVADRFKFALDQHFYRTAEEPTGFEYVMMKESDFDWEREGESLVELIQNYVEVKPVIAADIQSALEEFHFDPDSAQRGAEQPFGKEAQYTEGDVDDSKSQASWRRFEEGLKTQARYFNRTAEWTLESIFEGIADYRTHDNRPVVVEAGPDAEIKAIYRARVFQSDVKLENALRQPDEEIGPPPPRDARAGRMNPHGISVFYGATDPAIALAEVRPPVAARVVVGRFELIKTVRLLDLEALRSVQVKGSIFDTSYLERLEKAKFLEWLSKRITMPVMPDDEAYDYLSTQAIADFLATNAKPLLHGIIYPSVQVATGKSNIVLFHKAARVQPLDPPPKGTKVSVFLNSWTDDGPETDYWISEQAPPRTTSKSGSCGEEGTLSQRLEELRHNDDRQFMLKLDLSSVEVHHVTGVSFTIESHSVTRHRFE